MMDMAAEPTSAGSAGIAAILIALMGPLGGEYSAIIFAALGGALWPLSTMKGTTKRSGAFFLFRIVTTAVLLTSVGTYILEHNYGLPALHGMTIVAFVIGALGNGWSPVLSALRDGIAAFFKTFVSNASGRSQGNGDPK